MKIWCAEPVHLRDTKCKIQPSRSVIFGGSYLLAFPFISMADVQLAQDRMEESELQSDVSAPRFFFWFCFCRW